jgi:hypothetical protein
MVVNDNNTKKGSPAEDDSYYNDPIIEQFLDLQNRWGDIMLKTLTTPKQQKKNNNS